MKLVRPLTALAIAIATVVMPGAAHASAPHASAATAALYATTSVTKPVAADDLLARIDVSPATSAALEANQDLALTVTITNTTGVNISAGTVSIYLSNAAVPSRAELSNWLTGPAPAVASLGPAIFTSPTVPVAAGNSEALSITVPAASVGLSGAWGARTLAAAVSSANTPIGLGRSAIVWSPGGAPPTMAVGITVPLTVPRTSAGLLSAGQLATYTGVTGFLTEEFKATSGRTVSIAVDPMIVASIRILGDTAPESAKDWLRALEGTSNDTFALGYADSDLSVGIQAGAAQVLAPTSFTFDPDLFPGLVAPSPQATSPQASSASAPPTVPPITPGSPSATTSASPSPDTTIYNTASLVSLPYSLGGIAWPPTTGATAADLAAFATAGLTTSILSSSAVSAQTSAGPAVSVAGHPAVISDDSLAHLIDVAAAAPSDVAWQQAMANLSASLAVVATTVPGPSSTLFAALSRAASNQNSRIGATINALYSLNWVTSTTLRTLAATPGTPATLTPATQSSARVTTVAALLAAEAAVAQFSSVLTDPTVLSGERRLSLLAILSNAWRPTSTEWQSVADAYLAKCSSLLESVHIVTSSSLYLTSKNSHVDVTVGNSLSYPVTVFVNVRSPSGSLEVLNPRVSKTIQGNSQAKVSVPVRSIANGKVTVHVTLLSATQVHIAQPARIKVDVQADWETAFTAVIIVGLVLLFGFGIFRNVRKRRRAKNAAAPDAVNSPVVVNSPESPGEPTES